MDSAAATGSGRRPAGGCQRRAGAPVPHGNEEMRESAATRAAERGRVLERSEIDILQPYVRASTRERRCRPAPHAGARRASPRRATRRAAPGARRRAAGGRRAPSCRADGASHGRVGVPTTVRVRRVRCAVPGALNAGMKVGSGRKNGRAVAKGSCRSGCHERKSRQASPKRSRMTPLVSGSFAERAARRGSCARWQSTLRLSHLCSKAALF